MSDEKLLIKAIEDLGFEISSTLVQPVNDDKCLYAFVVNKVQPKVLVKNVAKKTRVRIDATKRKENLQASVGVRFTKNETLLMSNLESVLAQLKSTNKTILGFAFFKQTQCLSIRQLYNGKAVPTNNVYEYVKTVPTLHRLGLDNKFGADVTVKIIYR